MTSDLNLILGSASPRRRRILRAAGIRFRAVSPTVEEALDPARPRWTARQNALRKLAWCRSRWPDRRILTADTVIAFRGRCITKPGSRREAARILRELSGNLHSVLTAVAYVEPGRPIRCRLAETRVKFRRLSPADIRAYLRRVDPKDKAGGYNIEEYGERLIASCRGSASNVAGLPMEIVLHWLSQRAQTRSRGGAGARGKAARRPARGRTV